MSAITKMKALILALAFLSCNAFASDEYVPPITVIKSKIKLIVRQDATYDEQMEALYRIDTDDGVKSYSTVKISYDKTAEKCQIVEAYTIQPNGKKIAVKADAIKVTSDPVSRRSPMFSDTKNISIIFPKVEKGSLIYYKTKSRIFRTAFPNIFSMTKYMSETEAWQDYTLDILYHPKIQLKTEVFGVDIKQKQDQKGMKHLVFHYSNNTIVESEPNEVDSDDFSPYLRVTNLEDYAHLGRLYASKATKAEKITPIIKQKADELTSGINDRKEQAQAIYEWVSQNIRYVYIDFGQGGLVPHTASTILDNLYGDCKDHATLLNALLAAKGITGHQVLINMGESYKLPKLADTAFNHVINYVPEFDLYLDSTAELARFGTIPSEDMDKLVLVTGLNIMAKTPLATSNDNIVEVDTNLVMQADGSIKGTNSLKVKGDKEISARSTYSVLSGMPKEKAASRLFSANYESGTGDYEATDPLDLKIPFRVKSYFTIDPPGNIPGPSGILIPLGLSNGELNDIRHYKPIKKITRPMVCISAQMIEKTTFELLPSIEIISIPKNTAFYIGDYSYRATYSLKGKTLTASRELISNHPKGYCDIAEYENYKNFTMKVREDIRSQIIYK
jgi:transglutaminase-like putative cysteine protease